MQPTEELKDHIMERIKALLLTAKVEAEHNIEPLQLPEEPKRLKLTKNKTRDPKKSSPPRPSCMLGTLTLITTDYDGKSRNTTGKATASSLTTKKETATTDTANSKKAKPFHPPKEPEALSMEQTEMTKVKPCKPPNTHKVPKQTKSTL